MTIRQRVESATVEELPTIAAEIAEGEAALRIRLNSPTAKPRAEGDPVLTPQQVASALTISPWSAGELIRRGILASVPRGASGRHRGVRLSAVEKYKADNERGATMRGGRK